MKIIPGSSRPHYLIRVSVFLVIAVLIAGMAGCGDYTPPSKDLEIRDWYDLDAVRDNLAGNHTLMNDLDSTTTGYEELASPTANGGKGWEPIGTKDNGLTGSFDGREYEVRDLFINRPDEDDVGLFSALDQAGVIKNIGLTNATVIGQDRVGGLAGHNYIGAVNNSYSTGNVIGDYMVGGLVGEDFNGSVSHSYSGSDVSAISGEVGGLVGTSVEGTVTDSYSTGSVNGCDVVGGLLGLNLDSTVSNSYSTGSVTGTYIVGGLVAINGGTLSNSYATGNVTGDENIGGLVGYNEYGTVGNCYSTGNVTGGITYVGGLIAENEGEGIISNSYWDIITSGQNTSAGGTGQNSTEMKDIVTFSEVDWNIIAVALNETNPAYIWNIVNNVTYPFLSWQS